MPKLPPTSDPNGRQYYRAVAVVALSIAAVLAHYGHEAFTWFYFLALGCFLRGDGITAKQIVQWLRDFRKWLGH